MSPRFVLLLLQLLVHGAAALEDTFALFFDPVTGVERASLVRDGTTVSLSCVTRSDCRDDNTGVLLYPGTEFASGLQPQSLRSGGEVKDMFPTFSSTGVVEVGWGLWLQSKVECATAGTDVPCHLLHVSSKPVSLVQDSLFSLSLQPGLRNGNAQKKFVCTVQGWPSLEYTISDTTDPEEWMRVDCFVSASGLDLIRLTQTINKILYVLVNGVPVASAQLDMPFLPVTDNLRTLRQSATYLWVGSPVADSAVLGRFSHASLRVSSRPAMNYSLMARWKYCCSAELLPAGKCPSASWGLPSCIPTQTLTRSLTAPLPDAPPTPTLTSTPSVAPPPAATTVPLPPPDDTPAPSESHWPPLVRERPFLVAHNGAPARHLVEAGESGRGSLSLPAAAGSTATAIPYTVAQVSELLRVPGSARHVQADAQVSVWLMVVLGCFLSVWLVSRRP